MLLIFYRNKHDGTYLEYPRTQVEAGVQMEIQAALVCKEFQDHVRETVKLLKTTNQNETFNSNSLWNRSARKKGNSWMSPLSGTIKNEYWAVPLFEGLGKGFHLLLLVLNNDELRNAHLASSIFGLCPFYWSNQLHMQDKLSWGWLYQCRTCAGF